jgi:hypothetical protein
MLERTANRYTATDAARHEKFVAQQIEYIEEQLDRIEKKIN